MGRIYRFPKMTVGVIQHDLNDAERQIAYAITTAPTTSSIRLPARQREVRAGALRQRDITSPS
jgi:hypothetical protein